ncbi:ATPase [Candidatus Parcubacteria bacterium]|nr:MAG: ATPase [Candidatus Parcubacteria bacterium]
MADFHSQNLKEIFKELETSEKGIDYEEAKKRIKKYGENKLSEQKPIGMLTIFISQFKNTLIYILLFTGGLSLIIGAGKEAIVIFTAVIINVLLGFFQENKANQALQKLKKMSDHKAIVFREGKEHEILTKDLVPGDIIALKAGNKVPCDARLIITNELQINESALTGESIPSKKNIEVLPAGAPLGDRSNMVFAGTLIIHGSGTAVVTTTGEKTEIGKIASLVREAKEEKTPLQKRLEDFSRSLGAIFVVICTLIVLAGLIQGRGLFDMIETGVAVGVASIPEGLTVAITFILALGMQRILKKKALTRKLIAAETLGSVTVICTDKTGTLTKGEMKVNHIVIGEKEFEISNPGSRQDNKEAKIVSLALQVGMMCNDANIENPDNALSDWKFIGSSTETALLSAAIQSGLKKDELLKNERLVAKLPFDSEKKYMLSLHQNKDDDFILYQKGAPEKLFERSVNFYHQGVVTTLNDEHKHKLTKTYEKMTSQGLRVIGVALKNIKKDHIIYTENKEINWHEINNEITFIGFIAIKDPLREEAKETIRVAKEAGIRPILITGDHKLTAKAIASEVGMDVNDENILTGNDLEIISDEELKKKLKKINLYARVSPHHKLRVVRALQDHGEIVAMTGDGINDSPALKAADIGISLGTGTDIAKETSDLVLLDDNFKTILAAIKQGRTIFRNIRKVITYLISDSFSEIILIVGSIIFRTPLAILPVQILWINIINDGFSHFSLAFEGSDKSIMKQKPIKNNEALLNNEMKWMIFGVGIFRDVLIFAFFYILYYNWKGDPELLPILQTIIFATLGVKSLMAIFSFRHFHTPIWRCNPFSNPLLILSVAMSFTLLYLAVEWAPLQKLMSTVDLSLKEWSIPFLFGLIGVALTELVKLHFTQNIKKSKKNEKEIQNTQVII